VVVAALSRSLYLDVGGELVWLGPRDATLHGRAIVADEVPALDAGDRVETSFDLRAAREWRPAPAPTPLASDGARHQARRLAGALARGGRPEGFGALLAGGRPAFPLDRAAADARRFLDACAGDDAAGGPVLAGPLLGLGPGLTPAGDDLVGGAFFAKVLVGEAAPRWREGAAAVRALARGRTHPISAMLLGDLVGGEGHAPLHDVLGALVHADAQAADRAAARLVRIGHSSGWDMLAGVLGALGALPALPAY
jgi:hypothetical protein